MIWTVPADAVSDTARVKVVVWMRTAGDPTDAASIVSAARTSGPFRIVP